MLVTWSDILDGEIVNAAWAVVQMAAKPRTSRRVATELETASWADTERLIRDALVEIETSPYLPDLSGEEVAELEAALKQHEFQGALQTLLATRLTDAPEEDAAKARKAVRLALSAGTTPLRSHRISSENSSAKTALFAKFRSSVQRRGAQSSNLSRAPGVRYAELLSDYFDDRISALVGELEGRVGFAGLAQVRAEAYNTRIVALLGAIERQVSALTDSGLGSEAAAEWVTRYRRQALERHGKIEPPDFERRRRVPIERIFVDTSVYAYSDNRVEFGWHEAGRSSLRVTHLADRIDRTVLLGNPGGGKTTATSVLTNYFATDVTRRIPFVVTLRDYAGPGLPGHSVVGHIERTLETLYQCAPPKGLVERFLLTGRAIVIFDGLDELLETSRRRDVSDRVEQFCSAYPLTQVLVTSREVGYDEAKLDVHQFDCYRLGGFDVREITEYVHKWFSVQEYLTPLDAQSEAQSFLAESESAHDLRYNPLMLSLMCILYRGSGSLPRDRAGIYGKCSELLIGKWDERRKIHHELQAGRLVEPAIRYLAWWLLNGHDSSAAVTERSLIRETASFLYGRGFESDDDARIAAKEFVDFCRGRMWVFIEVGTSADGEKLYAFAHRTFLEYFAAAHLATISDTPEDLARAIAPHVSSPNSWQLVGELAIQIKDSSSDRGSDRIYATLLSPSLAFQEDGPKLTFLVRCLESVRLSPAMVRSLIRALMDYRMSSNSSAVSMHPFRLLLAQNPIPDQLITDEIERRLETVMASGTSMARAEALLLILEIRIRDFRQDKLSDFWSQWSAQQIGRYHAEISAEAIQSSRLRTPALKANAISLAETLRMPRGLGVLMESYPQVLGIWDELPYAIDLLYELERSGQDADVIANFALIGRRLESNADLPWARCPRKSYTYSGSMLAGIGRDVDIYSGLGAAAVYAMFMEIGGDREMNHQPILDLPMPTNFQSIFLDWLEGRVSFVEIIDE